MRDIKNFFKQYATELNKSILELDIAKLNEAAQEIIKTIKKKKIISKY